MTDIKREIASVFEEIAQGIETGTFGKSVKIAVAGMGSEHGEENVMAACLEAARDGIEVIYIGTLEAEGIETVFADCADDCLGEMENLLNSGKADAAVAMHYPFPIGVATVGRVVAPATGRKYFVATTTGTAATDRVEAMVKGAIAGIATAKAYGVENPTVAILNLDGARQTEMILKKLSDNGYPITAASSKRADGGAVVRGNDVLLGSQDVLVTDSLTGNVLVKMLSSFSSGGTYETVGEGYGPGVGEGMSGIVHIISRASGSSLIAGAIRYAAAMAKGDLVSVYKNEMDLAKKAGLNEIIEERKAKSAKQEPAEEIKAPPAEVVTYEISGIEVLDLEDAVQVLWRENIYAQSGMGCTGPVVMVSEANSERSLEILRKAGYVSED
ncbi:MAG: glycine/sarcosine/betaine reductase complex component C subunit alpha [Eubacteriales bacterium]|nr:glycine/sarcosine/betaine reductase complex component C subunit alpha [Eubacteriales bacterium]MDD4323681.1 glycine/sarcosine/betaine reductase complex component C subunit alpha [Eubacteriales bacterium]MDD4540657.1 glycine/sarcosine/betaine reductase complex component C subunit alpha [Eubacteriales bacterium]